MRGARRLLVLVVGLASELSLIALAMRLHGWVVALLVLLMLLILFVVRYQFGPFRDDDL